MLSGDAVGAGKLTFGGGANAITTGGTSVFNGSVDFGGGADILTIGGTSSFTGQLTNATGLAVGVQKGTFGVVKAANIASLNVTDGGTLAVTLSQAAGKIEPAQRQRHGQLRHRLQAAAQRRQCRRCGGPFRGHQRRHLTGGSNLAASTDLLPFLYKGTLSVTGNQVAVDIARKNATELGLNRSESAAYGAIYEALTTDDDIGDSFLAIRNQEEICRSSSARCCPNTPAVPSRR